MSVLRIDDMTLLSNSLANVEIMGQYYIRLFISIYNALLKVLAVLLAKIGYYQYLETILAEKVMLCR